MIDRRAFLGGLIALTGSTLLDPPNPLKPVWSFPRDIVVVNSLEYVKRFRGDFAQLLAPGVHKIFLDMLDKDYKHWEEVFRG